jgi:metal-responsive CopG/Arc/MetJ family transcriptional regulator
MTSEKNVALPDDLLMAVAEIARTEGKTADEVIAEATRRYLARERMDRFVRRNEQRARDLRIAESDVPRIVEDFRREQRGR